MISLELQILSTYRYKIKESKNKKIDMQK